MIEDLGKKSIQCGRKVDAVKLWFAWKYFGLEGYKNRIDNLIEMAKYAEKKVIENTKLELIVPRQSFSVCFRYIPEINTDSNEFNLKLRESLRKSGKSIVNFGYIGDSLTIRLIAANAELNKSDIDLFFNNLIDEAELIISGT
jgi:sulfinoalanine decarboxylase